MTQPTVIIREKRSPVGFLGLLTLLFITLKLTGTINWSWWLVLGPMWMPIAIGLGLWTVCALLLFVVEVVTRPASKKTITIKAKRN